MDIKEFNGNYEEVYGLWNRTLDNWTIEKEQLINRITDGKIFIASENYKIIGFIGCQSNGQKGQITLIMVDNKYQRQGIGTKLLNKAKEYLNKSNITEVLVGAGAGSYFWPGIPLNLLHSIKFFEKNGFKYDETNLDMVGNIEDYQTPPEVLDKTKHLYLSFKTLNPSEIEELEEFEKNNFPNWLKYFESAIKEKSLENILIAKNNQKILGSVILFGSKGFIWSKLLNNVGGFGALGVSENQRGKGIGLALAAKATEILKSRGVENSYLGWTYLDKWYGKLGYKVWQEYYYGHLE